MSIHAGGPEVELITESVENANARIRFFRIACGAASAGQMISNSEICAVLRDMTHGGKLNIDWTPAEDQERVQVKLAFLLIQCFETAMPWGGQIKISELGGEWSVYGSADRMQIQPELWENLSRPAGSDAINASKVHFALAPIAATAADRRLVVESEATQARVRF